MNTKAYRHTRVRYSKSLKVELPIANVEVVPRMFLSKAVTSCSGEISFSALGRMKNFLTSTLHGDKIKALVLLSIESKFVKSISFDGTVEYFIVFKIEKEKLGINRLH